MKTMDDFIEERIWSQPWSGKDLIDAYRLGQINMLLELNNLMRGQTVNGICQSVIMEEQLTDMLIKVSNAN